MNNVLVSKVLASDEVAKLVEEFDADDFAMRDEAEIKTFITLLMKESKVLSDARDEAIRACGSAEISSKIARVDGIVKSLLSILSSRVSSEETDDKTVVCLKKDEVVSVSDGDGEHYETETVDDERTLFYTEVTYSVPSVGAYNEAAGSNLTEEDFYYALLCKLHDLEFDSALSYGKVKMSLLDSNIVTDIIQKNKRWHTLVGTISVSKAGLNKCLASFPEARSQLLAQHFVFDERVSKAKTPTSNMIQGNLFDFNDFLEVNLLSEETVSETPVTEGGESNE